MGAGTDGPLRVVVRRAGVQEAVHRVHAVFSDGRVHGADLTCFIRSAAKPFQAIPLVDAYPDLGADEIAIACSSHEAEPAQLAAVRKLLVRAGASVDDLENGPQACRPDGKLGHNCSGKHAGMLAACRANGWPMRGYHLPGHPLQQQVATMLGGGPTGTDGCGVPTFALPLSRMASLFTSIRPEIAAAMRAHPELVGGDGIEDTLVMRALPGSVAKRGAEGLLCIALPDGTAVALKAEDGSSRALAPGAAALLGLPGLAVAEVRSSLGDPVGEIAAEPR